MTQSKAQAPVPASIQAPRQALAQVFTVSYHKGRPGDIGLRETERGTHVRAYIDEDSGKAYLTAQGRPEGTALKIHWFPVAEIGAEWGVGTRPLTGDKLVLNNFTAFADLTHELRERPRRIATRAPSKKL